MKQKNSPIQTGPSSSPPADVDTSSKLFDLQRLHRRTLAWLFPQATDFSLAQDQAFNAAQLRKSNGSSSSPQPAKQSNLDHGQVVSYLSRYQSMNDYFPFVALPEGYTVALMQIEHPFLLLGLLAVMSVDDLELNGRLHAEFRKALSYKAILQDEKSLDLVQGLLVYIAWSVP
jgi:hypothetical protein